MAENEGARPWRDFCSKTEGIHESSKLYKILGHSPIGKLGMLQLPNGTWTNYLDETYAHLLEVHFPGCTRISDDILQQVPKRALLFNCNEVRRVVTEDRIKWAFSTMAPYKTPGQDGIYPVLL